MPRRRPWVPPALRTAWEDRGGEEGQRPPGTRTGEEPGHSLGAGPMAPAGRLLSKTPERQTVGTPVPSRRTPRAGHASEPRFSPCQATARNSDTQPDERGL